MNIVVIDLLFQKPHRHFMLERKLPSGVIVVEEVCELQIENARIADLEKQNVKTKTAAHEKARLN